MKKLVLTSLTLLALTVSAKAELEAITGAAVGYGFSGATTHEPVYAATGGACLKTFNEGNTKLYSIALYRGTGAEANWGAEMILANRIGGQFPFWVLVTGGALDNAFTNGDGSEDMAASFGAGLAVSLSKYQSAAVYFKSYRSTGAERTNELWVGTQAHILGF